MGTFSNLNWDHLSSFNYAMEQTAYTTVEAFLKSRSPYNVRSVAVYSLNFGESLNVANTNYTGSVRGLLYITVCPSTVAHNQKREGCLLLKYTCVVEIEGTEYGKVFRALVLPQNLQTIRQTTLQYARGTNFKYHYGEVMTFLDDRYCIERFESDSAMNLFAKANWVKNQQIDTKTSTLTEGSLLIFTQLLHRESDNKLPANFKCIDGNATIWNLICERKSVAAGCVEVKCTKLGESEDEIDKFIYKPFPSKRLLEWKKTKSNTLGTDPINQIVEANKQANLKSSYTKQNQNTGDMVGPLGFRVFNPTTADFSTNKDKPAVNETKEKSSEKETLFPRSLFDNLNFIEYETLTKTPPDKETQNLLKGPLAKQMCSIVAAFCKNDDTFVSTNSKEPSSNEVEMGDMELNCLFELDSPTMQAPLIALDTAKPIELEPETDQTADVSLNVDESGASIVTPKKLVKVKTSEYIRKHPELQSQLSTYVIAVLKEQPEDLQTFAVRFFGTGVSDN